MKKERGAKEAKDENRKFEIILQANVWVRYYTFIKFVLDTPDVYQA